MNRLQNLETQRQYFVTLNRVGEIPDAHVINRTVLHHPQFDRAAMATQEPLRKQNGHRNTWLVGSYFGYGFHEDAVRSAVEATDKLLAGLNVTQRPTELKNSEGPYGGGASLRREAGAGSPASVKTGGGASCAGKTGAGSPASGRE
jgi:predicted NAD/FAD-binding protein